MAGAYGSEVGAEDAGCRLSCRRQRRVVGHRDLDLRDHDPQY